MGTTALSLDTIQSAAFYHAGLWTPALRRNQSQHLLRHLLCRLYGASRGQLFHGRIRCSYAALAEKLELSREWTCKLSRRLQEAGWIRYRALRLPDGKFEVGVFAPGPQLKRLLCMLLRYRTPKYRVNDRSQYSPLPQKEREKLFSSHQQKVYKREQAPPIPAVVANNPILSTWVARGESTLRLGNQ